MEILLTSSKRLMLPLEYQIPPQGTFCNLSCNGHAIYRSLCDKIRLFQHGSFFVLLKSYLAYFPLKFLRKDVVDSHKMDYRTYDKLKDSQEYYHRLFHKQHDELYKQFDDEKNIHNLSLCYPSISNNDHTIFSHHEVYLWIYPLQHIAKTLISQVHLNLTSYPTSNVHMKLENTFVPHFGQVNSWRDQEVAYSQ